MYSKGEEKNRTQLESSHWRGYELESNICIVCVLYHTCMYLYIQYNNVIFLRLLLLSFIFHYDLKLHMHGPANAIRGYYSIRAPTKTCAHVLKHPMRIIHE